jgi:glutathione S-transferase
MQRPLLYTYRRCPYAMRARMALLHAGVDFDAFEIVLRDKPAALLQASPKGTVPVLVLPHGQVIEQSLEIMQWALAGRDSDGWWQRAQTPACLAFTARLDGEFKQHLDAYKYPQRHPQEDRDGRRDAAVRCLLQPLEQHLAAHRALGGEAPCATDLAVFPFVRQFRAVDEAWFDAQPLPSVRAWLQGWLQSALFARCMAKLPANQVVQF